MEDCCASQSMASKALCPSCGAAGKQVGRVTLESLLTPEARALAQLDMTFFLCPGANCSLVYFSSDGSQSFSVDTVKVPVWQKAHGAPDVPVCYCFGHTPASIERELTETGESTTVATISAKIKASLCECETNNPQGSCCLGNVNAVVKRLKSNREAAPNQPLR